MLRNDRQHKQSNPQTEKQKAVALAAARQQEMEGMKELSNMESQVILILIIYPYKDLTLYGFLFPGAGHRYHQVKQRTVDGEHCWS